MAKRNLVAVVDTETVVRGKPLILARFRDVGSAEDYIAGKAKQPRFKEKVERGAYSIDAPEEMVNPPPKKVITARQAPARRQHRPHKLDVSATRYTILGYRTEKMWNKGIYGILNSDIKHFEEAKREALKDFGPWFSVKIINQQNGETVKQFITGFDPVVPDVQPQSPLMVVGWKNEDEYDAADIPDTIKGSIRNQRTAERLAYDALKRYSVTGVYRDGLPIKLFGLDRDDEEEKQIDEDDEDDNEEITYEIRAYRSEEDFNRGEFFVPDVDIIDKEIALEFGRQYATQYPVIKVLSSDGEFEEVIRRNSTPSGIEIDTAIVPGIIADGVCEELAYALRSDVPLQYGDELVTHAETVYMANRENAWGKNLRDENSRIDGRDYLASYMRHWLAAIMAKEYPDLFTSLRRSFPDYLAGKPIPADPLTTHMMQVPEEKAPRKAKTPRGRIKQRKRQKR